MKGNPSAESAIFNKAAGYGGLNICRVAVEKHAVRQAICYGEFVSMLTGVPLRCSRVWT